MWYLERMRESVVQARALRKMGFWLATSVFRYCLQVKFQAASSPFFIPLQSTLGGIVLQQRNWTTLSTIKITMIITPTTVLIIDWHTGKTKNCIWHGERKIMYCTFQINLPKVVGIKHPLAEECERLIHTVLVAESTGPFSDYLSILLFQGRVPVSVIKRESLVQGQHQVWHEVL